ncbi:MAG: DEAD/DEAH box helicase [Anaerolineales bacterium]|nr:DEAD/DEAH box helicase [Anaerolineales bacterium]
MNFQEFNLDSRLTAGIRRAGYTEPTPIQIHAIPQALAGQDLIGTAQTGTGKTAAFVLPILQRLLPGPRRRARALIVTPTRELAEQIHGVIRALGAQTGLRSATIYGGVGAAPQIQAFQSGVEILVACPGRLLDHIQQRRVQLGAVEVLVLDEADRMLDMGFLPDVKRILAHLPARRQTMLFSATFPHEIEQLAAQCLTRPQRIAVGMRAPVHTVAHALYPVPQHLKSALVLELLRLTDTESVLIFTRTKHRAEKLARQLSKAGHRVTSLHSNRSQGQRQAALGGFKDGRYRIMVATDIAARGLDVENISHVINFDMPDTADAYIHRIGRTGRAERTGDAFTLVTPEDGELIRTLEKIMKQPLPRRTLEGFDYKAAPPPRPSNPVRTPRGAGRNTRASAARKPCTGTAARKPKAPSAKPAHRGWRQRFGIADV